MACVVRKQDNRFDDILRHSIYFEVDTMEAVMSTSSRTRAALAIAIAAASFVCVQSEVGPTNDAPNPLPDHHWMGEAP
jgi:hypothetical protein